MISKIQAQTFNTQSFKANPGTITKNALESLQDLTIARENDGIAMFALEFLKRGDNIEGVQAFSESGSTKLALRNGTKKSQESIPSFVLQTPEKYSEASEVQKGYDNKLHENDEEALKELKQFVAVA